MLSTLHLEDVLSFFSPHVGGYIGSRFLPAALAEAGLEIAFKVGPSRTTLSGGGELSVTDRP